VNTPPHSGHFSGNFPVWKQAMANFWQFPHGLLFSPWIKR
jgi:hypothetical protein